MIQRDAPTFDSVPERLMPAWIFSALFHFTAIIVLGVAIQPSSHGAAEEPSRSAGIVLKTTSAEGDLFEGEEDLTDTGEPASAGGDATQNLLSALPDEPAPTPPTETTPQEPTPGAGPSSAAGASQPNASTFTKGGGRRGSPGGGSSSAQVTVFGVTGEGTKFVYLFDRSSSMEGAPLAAAKRQLLESLASLDGIHQFHIIFFNTKTLSFDISGGGRRIAFATDRNKHLASNFVGNITADGGTDRLTALKQAIHFAPDVIFFLTDADDPMSAGELADIARTNARAQSKICVIEFGRRQSPSPDNFLTELARQSGGQYGYINTATLTQ